MQTLTPTELHVTTGSGTELEYLDSAEDRGTRRVIVLVHGTGGSATQHFGFLHPILANKQRVVSVSLSDPGTPTLELDQLVEQVLAVVDAITGDAQITLLGYSLGAVVAARAAALHPDRFASLVLVCGWARSDTQLMMRNRVLRTLIEEDSAALGDYWAFTAFSRSFLLARSPEELSAIVGRIGFSPFTRKQIALNGRIDIEESLPAIACPTLVVSCSHDIMVPPQHSTFLWAAIADARLASIDSGHAVVAERPAQLCALVQEFAEHPHRYAAGTRVLQHQP